MGGHLRDLSEGDPDERGPLPRTESVTGVAGAADGEPSREPRDR
ncbi:hypothetical protein [Streptomyces avidinii]